MRKQIVVLHSGGQDSTTCLAWAIDTWSAAQIHPVLFNYNQRHSVEMQQALIITEKLRIPNRTQVIPVEALDLLAGAALTNSAIDVALDATDTGNEYAAKRGLPSTFIPGRNMLFFTLAAAYGTKVGADTLVTGVCATDRAGYPDCRVEFVKAAGDALSLALDEQVHMIAPLLRRSKAETWALADQLGVLDLIVEDTHTCYHGDRSKRWDWGYGCGECPACTERQLGWDLWTASRMKARLP